VVLSLYLTLPDVLAASVGLNQLVSFRRLLNDTSGVPSQASMPSSTSLYILPRSKLLLDHGAGSERNADQRGQGLRTDFPHDRGAVIVHSALGNIEISRDVLAWNAG
jgi:hypothetical protein